MFKCLERFRRPVAESRVQVFGVVANDPSCQGIQEAAGTRKLINPDQLLLQRTHEPLGIRIALGVQVASEGLIDAHDPADSHGALCYFVQ